MISTGKNRTLPEILFHLTYNHNSTIVYMKVLLMGGNINYLIPPPQLLAKESHQKCRSKKVTKKEKERLKYLWLLN